MFNPSQLKGLADEWMQGLSEKGLPGKAFSEEMKMMAKAHFQQLLVQANLVTREEFDVQAELLSRTQDRLTHLEQQLTTLQNQMEEQMQSELEPKD
ncbi:MAG: accessory factor UbiK family protein [Oleispira sp.]|nr:accessory factor UbiK family protein [Oleispira sp.]MBL4879987.1 accessory factor UbiK family protein [Oleispira sp.]